jgi:hypothetical protein
MLKTKISLLLVLGTFLFSCVETDPVDVEEDEKGLTQIDDSLINILQLQLVDTAITYEYGISGNQTRAIYSEGSDTVKYLEEIKFENENSYLLLGLQTSMPRERFAPKADSAYFYNFTDADREAILSQTLRELPLNISKNVSGIIVRLVKETENGTIEYTSYKVGRGISDTELSDENQTGATVSITKVYNPHPGKITVEGKFSATLYNMDDNGSVVESIEVQNAFFEFCI